jgi:putative tryptophan/tyrosine transport system permease protein
MFYNILEQSFLFFPLALGIYISYAVLKIPDLTTDGSFLLGAALFGLSVSNGFHPALAILFCLTGSSLAGFTVSFLQTRLKINPLIAGILLVFILNTLTFKLLGKPNLSLLGSPLIFMETLSLNVSLFLLTLFLIITITCLLRSKLGLMLHAFGNNPALLNLFGRRSNLYRMAGLCISNGLVGLAGALTASASGYVDIGMGTGMILISLGTVIIGQQIYQFLFKKNRSKHLLQLFSVLVGVIAYFFFINILISLGLDPMYLRLMVGVCLVVFLGLTRNKVMKEALTCV